jgi:hypothetical protein
MYIIGARYLGGKGATYLCTYYIGHKYICVHNIYIYMYIYIRYRVAVSLRGRAQRAGSVCVVRTHVEDTLPDPASRVCVMCVCVYIHILNT